MKTFGFNFSKLFWTPLILSFICVQHAYAKGTETTLAVSQGISAPTLTTPINFSHGFVYNNSAIASKYEKAQLSLEYDQNEDSDDSGAGAELAIGTGRVGLGLGYYKRSCDGCEGKMGAIAGFTAGGTLSMGVGYREDDKYSLGLLYDLGGSHRWGLAADFQDNGDSDQNITSYGLGYAYVGQSFVFALDASKMDHGSSSVNDDAILVTPGILVRADKFALSVSYDYYMEDENEVYEDEAWFGVGYNESSWSLSFYKDYVGDIAVAFALQF